jgi:KUP system potassium uptake protein
MEASIQFADQIAPSAQNHAASQNAIGGVVRLRSRTQSIGGRKSIDFTKSADYEDAEDEDAGLRNEADYKRSQVRAALLFVLRFG